MFVGGGGGGEKPSRTSYPRLTIRHFSNGDRHPANP
jgi:hypothetical protein